MRVMEFIKLCCSMHFITQSPKHTHTVVRDVRQTQTQALFARLPLFVVPNLSFFVSLWVPTLCDNIGVPVIICLISSLALSLYCTSTTTKISLRCDAKNFGFCYFLCDYLFVSLFFLDIGQKYAESLQSNEFSMQLLPY